MRKKWYFKNSVIVKNKILTYNWETLYLSPVFHYNCYFMKNTLLLLFFLLIEVTQMNAQDGIDAPGATEYENGLASYKEKNYEDAIRWYTMGAEKGNAAAMFELGVQSFNGEGVTQNYIEAFNWYIKAANLGNEKAMFNLGVMYQNGYGVEQNYTEVVPKSCESRFSKRLQ